MRPHTVVPRWDLTHDPATRPLGCNGRYGRSGTRKHVRQNEPSCQPCLDSQNHYQRERRRGGIRRPPLKPCGTNAAAVRHRRNREPTCFRRRVAETRYVAERKAARLARTLEAVPDGAALVLPEGGIK